MITAETIIQALNLTGLDVFSPGSKDFAAGLSNLQKLEALSDFPYISANIRDHSGRLLFNPYEIVTRDGATVGFIGLSSIFENADVEVDDPVNALDAVVDEVASKAEIVVLLFHADEIDITKIQDRSYPIDLIVQSKARRRSMDGGDRLIPCFCCGDRGKYLYQFDLSIKDANKRLTDLSSQKKQIEALNRKLAGLRRNNLNPASGAGTDPELEKIKAEIDDIKQQKEVAEARIADAQNTINFIAHELGNDVVHRADVLKIIDDGKARISDMDAPQPAVPFTPAGERSITGRK